MSNPTPAETARAIDYDKAIDVVRILVGDETQIDIDGEYGLMVNAIAQALTAAHAQGWEECVEACASAVCNWCGGKKMKVSGVELKTHAAHKDVEGHWIHLITDGEGSQDWVGCYAAAIRALKGGPK